LQAFERTVPALEMTIQPNKSTWSPLELTLQRLETSWQRHERSLQAMDSTWRGHIDRRTQALAAALEIRLLWLRKQASELNAMDQMWRELKREIAANRQYPTIDPLAAAAALWVLMLTRTEARRKGGMLSGHFWLK